MANVTKLGSATLSTPVLPGGITNSSITTTTARPYSLSTMDVDTGLKYDAIQRKLQIESTLGEIFLDLGSDVVEVGQKVMVPDSCIMRITSEKGARTQTMPLENPLAGVARIGTQAQQGYERQTTLEYMQIHYTEYSQAVIEEHWGMNYNDLTLYNFYAGNQPRLSKWFAEDEGQQYREALLERYSSKLVASTSGTAVASATEYNNNWFIANTDFGAQPTYSSTDATHITNIDTALQNAATGTSGVNANIDLNYLINLNHYAETEKRIKPVTIGGQPTYVVLIPAPQFHKLLQTNSGQLGEVWENVSALTKEEQAFPGVVGRVMSLLIVKDTRYPELTSDYAGTHTIQYVQPGNTDGRTKSVYNGTTNIAWDIGFLMGQAAIIDWMVTPLHFESESTEYGKITGSGAFTERGINLGVYDTDTATNLNIKNFGSIVLAFTSTNIVTTA